MSIPRNASTAVWRKSSHSDGQGGSCVEVAGGLPDVVPVRDSKIPDSPTLVFANGGWAAMVSRITRSERAAR